MSEYALASARLRETFIDKKDGDFNIERNRFVSIENKMDTKIDNLMD